MLTDIHQHSDFVALIVDARVSELHQGALQMERFKHIYKASPGESCKNLDDYRSCVEFLLSRGIHRQGHIVAVGGGALLDFAGFVAASVLRGVSWSAVPTTLLAMVDAAIGGKVALNFLGAKNMIGAFHKPTHIWRDTSFLKTLPERELNSGKGEIAKYCFLNSDILRLVEKRSSLETIIDACAEYKMRITEEDFRESGKRKILNLGHSFGHALEALYGRPHGESVLWGMGVLFTLFKRSDLLDKLREICRHLNIPPHHFPKFSCEKVWDLLGRDKKSSSVQDLDLILIDKPGSPFIKNCSLDEIHRLLKNYEPEEIIL